MLKEPIEVDFSAIQANLHFTDRNFTETKFDRDLFNQQKQFVQPKSTVAVSLSVSRLYFLLNIFSFFATL